MEIWKDVVGWEGYYQVSNMGRVRSMPRPYKPSIRILKPGTTRGGYLMVILRCRIGFPDERNQTRRVNRLVLEAFTGIVPKDPRKTHAAHKNSIRDDNRLKNLYWATYAENFADKVRNGKIPKGKDHPRYVHGRYVKEYKNELSLKEEK